MLSSDVTIFDESINHLEHSKPFSGKSMLYQNDQNNANYSGQIQLDCSSLSNSGKWLNYKEAYLQIPFLVTMQGSVDISTAVNAFSVGLKSGYYQLIESMSVDLNQRNIVQLQNNLNILTNYRVLTSFSYDDLVKYGPILGIGASIDSAGSYDFSAGASRNGDGFSNNYVENSNKYQTVFPPPNEGAYKRLMDTTANPINTTTQLNKTSTIFNQEARTYYSTSGGGASTLYNWMVIATIRLKDICPAFSHLPLLKTANFRFIINYNSSITTLTVTPNATDTSATMVTTSIQQLSGQTNPIFVPSLASVNIALATANSSNSYAAYTLTISCNVVKNSLTPNGVGTTQFQTCRLYVPAYEIQPDYERNLIESIPRAKIEYNDYFVYRVTNISAGGPFNSLLTNGIVNPKAIIVVPFANQGSAGSINVLNLPQYQMVFDSAPATTCPNASLTAFNIQIGGSNVFNLDEQFQFSNFLDEFTHINALDGSQDTGINSGLISSYAWLNGYRFYCADLSRRLRPEDKLAKSILIRGTNNTSIALDLLVFVLYERHFSINIVSGDIEE